MVNVTNFYHRSLLNGSFENQLMLFGKHVMKTFLKIVQLRPKRKSCAYVFDFIIHRKNVLIDSFQDT